MKLKFQILLTLALTIICLVVITQLSTRWGIRLPGSADQRLIGVEASGWTNDTFSFVDSGLAAAGAKIGFAFDPKRPGGFAQIEFNSNGVVETKEISSGAPIYFKLPKKLDSVKITAKVKNPFLSETSQELRGVKLVRVSIEGSPFSFPKPQLLLSLTFLITCLVILLSYITNRYFISLFLVLAPLLVLFAKNTTAQWYVSLWLLIPLLVTVAGIAIGQKYFTDDDQPTTKDLSSKKALLIMIPIIIFGLWLRISTVSFGLPEIYHPDEARKINIMRTMLFTNDLDPNYFRHPSFMLYSGAALAKIWSMFHGNIVPDVQTVAPMARSVSAVFGAATLYLMYLLGSLLFDRRAGIIAAMTLAVNPLHVVCSRYIKEDVCMIFFCLLSLYLILKFIFQSSKSRYLLLAGLTAGFATSVKFTGILSACFLAAPLLVWLIPHIKIQLPAWVRLQESARSTSASKTPLSSLLCWSVTAGLLVVIGFLLITPYAVLNEERFIRDFLFERQHMSIGHTGVISAVNYFWSYHLHMSIFEAFGSILTWLSLIFLGALIARGDIKSLVPVLGFLLFYLPAEWVNAKPFPQAERYILPAIPFLGLCVGYAFSELKNLSLKNTFPRSASVLAILFGLALYQPTIFSLRHNSLIMNDTREAARVWSEEHIPAKSKIITDWYFYGPKLPQDKYTIEELRSGDGEDILQNLSLRSLQMSGAQYFITSSFFYDRYLFLARRGNATGTGFNEIFSTLKPLMEFAPKYREASYGFHNPVIRVYEIPTLTK